MTDLEAQKCKPPPAGRFTLTPEQLESFYDPKSLRALRDVGGASAIMRNLGTDAVDGLDRAGADFDMRRKIYGANSLPQKPPKSFLRICWDQMHDQVLIILSVAAVVSLALGLYETFGQPPDYDAEGKPEPKVEWVEGVAIIVAILIVVLVSAANDYNKERQFMKLNAKKEDRQIVVFRSGEKHFISILELLVGDIVTVETGDVVPGDSLLVSGECECDESSLTGETDTVSKVPADVAEKAYESACAKAASAGEKNVSAGEEGARADTTAVTPCDIGDKPAPGQRKARDPILISGSKLVAGEGRAVVTAVGVHSMHGKIMMSLRHENEETPLQKRLTNLANGISKYGFMVAVVLFVVLFIKFLAALGGKYQHLKPAEKGSKFLNIVITAITIVVVAIPEGLPLAVTLALAFATTRMIKDGNLVRVLKSCETMGSATAVCSDKTGTLTQNRMQVVKGVIGEVEFDDVSNANTAEETGESAGADGKSAGKESAGAESAGEKNPVAVPGNLAGSIQMASSIAPSVRSAITDNILFNSTAFEGDTAKDPFVGSKTECALLLLARDGFKCINKPLQSLRNVNDPHVAQKIPFESLRKWGAIVVKREDGAYRLYIKGASEMVFSRCAYYARKDGEVAQVDAHKRADVDAVITRFAEQALRTISLAHRDFHVASWPPAGLESERNPKEVDPMKIFGNPVDSKESAGTTSNSANDGAIPHITLNEDIRGGDFVLDGIVGIQDPLRPGVRDAIAQCGRAGVRVRMVTGDNVLTARAIARNCGILPEKGSAGSADADTGSSCMEGPTFRRLTHSQRLVAVPKLCVLARSSPEDKRVLVQTLQELGEVVAVTGDGTNDAPALKLADVGFSMGVSGTEVAREASDIILMTDDFGSIVNAIKWGRTVSTSIRKFVQFQLTVNITACALTFISAVADADGSSVLTAVQLLWVNLIMDTLAALALATDKPDEGVMDRRPLGRTAPLITTSMWKMICGQAIMQLTVTMILHFDGDNLFFGHHTTSHQRKEIDSLTFNTFVWLQVFKLFVTRKLDEGDGITNVRDRITRSNLDFFQHLFRNPYFIGIELLISGFQVLIMFVGGAAFSIARQTGAMWATALICGLLSFPVGWLIRILPDIWFERIFPTKQFNKMLDWAELGPLRRFRRRHGWTLRKKKGAAKAGPEEPGDSTGSTPSDLENQAEFLKLPSTKRTISDSSSGASTKGSSVMSRTRSMSTNSSTVETLAK